MNELTIYPATAEDVAFMTAHFPDSSAAVKHAERFQRQQAGKVIYFVARLAGQPIGHGLLKWGGATEEHVVSRLVAPCPDLEDLFVLSSLRSQGIGTSILQMAEASAQARGYAQLGLSVAVDNPAALRLYERLGYGDAGFGEYVEHGEFMDAQGQKQSWTESCLYLIKLFE